MICLGIESSCDETAVALVRDSRLMASLIATQADLHSIFGGVVPELASREHYRFIGPLFDRLIKDSGIHPEEIDAIAVTRGPGLPGSLLVGVAFAKALALALNKPLLGVNHLEAHLLAAGLEQTLIYPAIGALVSGGHTHLYHIASPWDFKELGTTLDDAAGEIFDKIGHSLGLPYPAGSHIDHLAKAGVPSMTALPWPYLDNDNLNFSFSGLKTAAIRYARESVKTQSDLSDFCATLNHVIAGTLAQKTLRAMKAYPVKSLWLAGGVAANSTLRHTFARLAEEHGLPFLAPSPQLCQDNAAMIAYNGFLLLEKGLYHDLDLEAIPRGKKIPHDLRFKDNIL